MVDQMVDRSGPERLNHLTGHEFQHMDPELAGLASKQAS